MLRTILYFFLFLIGITLLRSVIGIITKFVTGGTAAKREEFNSNPRTKVAGGTLRKDPVCGTYIPEDSAVRLDSTNGTHYFCSQECRDKFSAGAA